MNTTSVEGLHGSFSGTRVVEFHETVVVPFAVELKYKSAGDHQGMDRFINSQKRRETTGSRDIFCLPP